MDSSPSDGSTMDAPSDAVASSEASTSTDSATDTSTPDGSAATTCATQPLCDDFESDTVGMAPDPTLWRLVTGCTANSPNVAPGGGMMIFIDDTQSHSGTKSLCVVEGDPCGWYAVNTTAFSKITQQLYVRFYARFSGDPSSDGGTAATQNHNGFLSMWSGPASDALPDAGLWNSYDHTSSATTGELRLGFQTGALDWNNYIDSADSTLPDQDMVGVATSVAPSSKTWNCYEYHIDQTSNDIEFWYNSTSVSGLSWNGTAVTDVSDQWSTRGPPPLDVQTLGLGWLQLSTAETVWYDDVVVSGSRIYCQ